MSRVGPDSRISPSVIFCWRSMGVHILRPEAGHWLGSSNLSAFAFYLLRILIVDAHKLILGIAVDLQEFVQLCMSRCSAR
jgi:hypothetical protein